MATGSVNGKATDNQGQITPQEISRIDASVRGLEQAPSSRQQLGAFANWKQVQDQLGQPFNNERIPLNKLKLMRRDPMIGFGFHFTKTPLVRAPWFMKCEDPQIAAFMDGALRPIMPSLIIQCLQKLDFGFQAIAKRYSYEVPDSTYIDPNTGAEVPAWDSQPGNILPVALKPFVALPPEGSFPIFDDTSGEFAGINYKPPAGGGAPAGTGSKKKGAGGSEGEVEIDLYHSLWVTNEKESVFGNIYGYPRLGYVYPYWWSYWYRWAIADRAFERKGDPQTLVRHPEGNLDLGNGETISNAEYALTMADRLRSGAGVALPSTPYMGLDDKPSGVSEWSIEFLTGGLDLDPFDKSFDYIDVMKLRSIFVPEQALIEGGGGTSSRNVAKEMYQGLVEAQSIEMAEIVNMINRFIIPHLLITNFPEQFAKGIKCTMQTRGFAAADMEILQTIIQLIGQADADKLGVNVREALRQLNMPLMPQQQYDQLLADKAAAAAVAGPGGEIAPTRDASGVVPTPGRAPATTANTPGPTGSGGSSTATQGLGFAYTQPRHVIELSTDQAMEFALDLPQSIHFQDKAMRALAQQLWTTMRDFYRRQYDGYIDYLDAYDGEIHLSDDVEQEAFEFAPSDFMRDMARRVVDGWDTGLNEMDDLMRRAEQILDAMTARASQLTRKEAGLDQEPDLDTRLDWVRSRVGEMVAKTISTTRRELEDFTANYIADGALDPRPLANKIRAHFDDFPDWKASRYARTEARDAFNAGTLLTARANGISVVQAVDAQLGESDQDCMDRDGQFFMVDQALREVEHPNGTLGWRLLQEPVTLTRVDVIPDGNGAAALFDQPNGIVYLSNDLSMEDEKEFLHFVGSELEVV